MIGFLLFFLQVFGSVSPQVVTEKFPDCAGFTSVCSRLLVTEVRRRASNQSTEEAASSIAAYMQVNGTPSEEESSNGWMLLSALNVMGAEGEAMSEVRSSQPSANSFTYWALRGIL